jgi:DNA adenine methylase
MTRRNPSPLRYPGGKASMARVFEAVLYANNLQGGVYAEPFSGGAGAGIKLLEDGHVERIIINDADRALFCFWWAVMNRTDELVERINSTPLTVAEWQIQRDIYLRPSRRSRIDLGFATFYLNRCNRSGIIKNAGPIGGTAQSGEWKIDARFNRAALAERVADISAFGDRISVLNLDAQQFIENFAMYCDNQPTLIYADPPYYVKGRELYLNHYSDADHAAFAAAIQRNRELHWIMTYDNVPRVRQLYADALQIPFTLRYSAHQASAAGKELLIAPTHMVVPQLARDTLSQGGFFRPAHHPNDVQAAA